MKSVAGQASRAQCSRALPSRARVANNAPLRAQIIARTRAQQGLVCTANAPTVSDTKREFLKIYSKPIPALYNTVIQELIVQQHLQRYNASYFYNEVYALGCMSVLGQLCENLENKDEILGAYIGALGEDLATFQADAAKIEAWASSVDSVDSIKADAAGDECQQAMAKIAAASGEGKMLYTNLLAVGVFRLLELSKCTDPAALERIAGELGVGPDLVKRDLATYKGLLSKLSAARELMKEFLAREKRKTAERLEAKAAAASESDDTPEEGTGTGDAVVAAMSVESE